MIGGIHSAAVDIGDPELPTASDYPKIVELEQSPIIAPNGQTVEKPLGGVMGIAPAVDSIAQFVPQGPFATLECVRVDVERTQTSFANGRDSVKPLPLCSFL